jgi:dihydroorotate dehydrogenase
MRSAALRAGYRALIRPVLFRSYGADPERIHEAMINLLAQVASSPVARGVDWLVGRANDPVTVAGVRFAGRVGVAAGLDKDGRAAMMWSHLGFGFAELGTVTAEAQPGNPSPRLFRARRSSGLINRMGFNNDGASALASRLAGWGVRRGNGAAGIPLGVSIGKTKLTPIEQAVPDYVRSLETVHGQADYVAVNVSSPNTPGLRTLQRAATIEELLAALVARARELDETPIPVFVKIAPDVSWDELDQLLAAVVGAGAAGVIATNTTLGRTGLVGADRLLASQPGGLSGAPLTRRARQVVARTVDQGLPVIASGGIMTPGDAMAMLDLGAVAVQVYTGFIYSGPGLVAGINHWSRDKTGRS